MINVPLFIILVTVLFGTYVFCDIMERRQKKPKSKKISLEEVKKLVEDAQFWEMVKDVAEGKGCTKVPMTDTGYITILQPCSYHDCSCHESREDCCTTGVEINGQMYCKVLVNINKLCGLPDAGEKPDVSKILTDEECKILADKIVEFMKEKEDAEK